MKFTKKASLNLSINAIVILILAITMLGLGLAFMRNIFGTATGEFQEITGTVKKQMIDQMKETQKVVDISRPKVKIGIGDSTQVYIGFKNDGQKTKKFEINSSASSNTSLGGDTSCNIFESGADEVFLEFKTAPTTVLQGDVVVLPINIEASSDSDYDTCFYELIVQYYEATGPTKQETLELTVDVAN